MRRRETSWPPVAARLVPAAQIVIGSAALEQRVAHLERLLEGFQDSVYRESERHAKMITDLQLQVEPGAMSASLAEDARNRGL